MDGVLVVDYPPEEAERRSRRRMDAHGIAPIFLLAPTTPESRIAQVARLARGYVYYVSLKGVTGAATSTPPKSRASSPRSAGTCSIPVGVGFGIRDAASARAIAAHADAVVIGSRIIQEIETGPAAEAAQRAGRVACVPFARAMRRGYGERVA